MRLQALNKQRYHILECIRFFVQSSTFIEVQPGDVLGFGIPSSDQVSIVTLSTNQCNHLSTTFHNRSVLQFRH